MKQKLCLKCGEPIEEEVFILHERLKAITGRKAKPDGSPLEARLCFVCLQTGVRKIVEEVNAEKAKIREPE